MLCANHQAQELNMTSPLTTVQMHKMAFCPQGPHHHPDWVPFGLCLLQGQANNVRF